MHPVAGWGLRGVQRSWGREKAGRSALRESETAGATRSLGWERVRGWGDVAGSAPSLTPGPPEPGETDGDINATVVMTVQKQWECEGLCVSVLSLWIYATETPVQVFTVCKNSMINKNVGAIGETIK